LLAEKDAIASEWNYSKTTWDVNIPSRFFIEFCMAWVDRRKAGNRQSTTFASFIGHANGDNFSMIRRNREVPSDCR
jgi:hypothetical protein